MFNFVKMDIRRMFKMKSFYIILLISIFITLISTYSSCSVDAQKGYEEGYNSVETTDEETDEDTVVLGISGGVDGVNESPSLENMLRSSLHGNLLLLVICIFTVIYSSSDISSGFIKNIAGTAAHKRHMIYSKAVAILFYNIFMFSAYYIAQIVLLGIFADKFEVGNSSEIIRFTLTAFLLHLTISYICMTITIILKKSSFSMTIAVLLSSGFPSLAYMLEDFLLGKVGFNNPAIEKYMPVGVLSELNTATTGSDLQRIIIVGICFTIGALLLNVITFEKRDIV